jgi:hypothetical protein
MTWRAGDQEADQSWPGPLPQQRGPGGRAVRASDAERDQVLAELGDGFVAGRLSHETFVFRVEAALRARHRDDLDDQVADLPPGRRPVLERAAQLGRDLAHELGRTWRTAVDGLRRPARMLPVLVLPDGARQRYTIGRELACDMSIGDRTVSRWHADLRMSPGGWRLADLGSTNGTRLNGWRITGPVHVRPGDLVSFGLVTFVLAQAPPVLQATSLP